MKTLADAARSALDVQSACNLSGVVHSFSEAMRILRASPECKGTDWTNTHSISVLYTVQLAYLTGVAAIADCDYGAHYAECERLAAV